VKRSPVRVSSMVLPEKVQLFVCCMRCKFYRGLRLGELLGKPRPSAGFPPVLAARIEVARAEKRDFSELLVAQPQNVALIGAFPDWLLLGFFLLRHSEKVVLTPFLDVGLHGLPVLP